MPGINKFIINNNNNYYYNYNNDDDDDDDDDDNKDNENDIRHLVMEYNIILYHWKAPLGLSLSSSHGPKNVKLCTLPTSINE